MRLIDDQETDKRWSSSGGRDGGPDDDMTDRTSRDASFLDYHHPTSRTTSYRHHHHHHPLFLLFILSISFYLVLLSSFCHFPRQTTSLDLSYISVKMFRAPLLMIELFFGHIFVFRVLTPTLALILFLFAPPITPLGGYGHENTTYAIASFVHFLDIIGVHQTFIKMTTTMDNHHLVKATTSCCRYYYR